MNYREILQPGFERVVECRDAASGLHAVVAIHNTTLGPGLGGCRMREYQKVDDAVADVLRLSEGMTYKNAVCGIPFGGGKAVMLTDPKQEKGRREQFLAFGKFVEELDGRYITAEDMGTRSTDMDTVYEVTAHVTGRSVQLGGAGLPSPWTALGIFSGIKACLEQVYENGDYRGRTFAIQGVGNVGYELSKLLSEAGGELIVCDLVESNTKRVQAEFGAKVVSPDEILSVPSDVFSPCAIGGTVNNQTVETLQCRIIAGGANNQVDSSQTESRLEERGILYAPDFAINSGGVMLCAEEIAPDGFSRERLQGKCEGVYKTIREILAEASKSKELPNAIALARVKASLLGRG